MSEHDTCYEDEKQQESKQMKKIIQMVRGAFKKMKHDNLRLAGGTT